VVMQLVLRELAPIVGMEMNKPILAFIVTAWIIGTELNSIINNLNKAGVKVPLSLSKVSKQLTDIDKEKVE
jgi:phage-related holin